MAAPKGNKHAVGYGRPTDYEGKKTDKAVFEFASKYPKIDEEIAQFLDISIQTLNTWKQKHPSFLESLTHAKNFIDNRVVESLANRAFGYTKNETKVFCHEGCIITEDIKVEVEPNVMAQIFWLKNRQRKEWKDRHDTEVTVKDADKMALPELLAEIEKLKKDLE